MAAPQMKEPPVSKVLEDRVRADGEVVEHALAPDRTPDKVIYPEPEAPRTEGQTAPDSMADVQMARRTDAGPPQAMRSAGGVSPIVWVGVGVVAILIVAALAL